MTATAPTVGDRELGAGSLGAPRLRLMAKARHGHASRRRAAYSKSRSSAALAPPPSVDIRPPVLIAGGDAASRAQVREELAHSMPSGTRFEELGTFWELLVRAPASRAVILSGDLDAVPAETLLHTLAHRHPDLPVVSIGAASQIAN